MAAEEVQAVTDRVNEYGRRVCPGGLECCQGDHDCDRLLAAWDAGHLAGRQEERAACAKAGCMWCKEKMR